MDTDSLTQRYKWLLAQGTRRKTGQTRMRDLGAVTKRVSLILTDGVLMSSGPVLAAGKPKKPTLTACMRKLLVILNYMLKHRHPGET